jgi:glucan phosphoethanolaminetransferase (alkaline phosphatase superfamily)
MTSSTLGAPVERRAMWALSISVALLMLPNLVWLWYAHGILVWVCAVFVPVALLLTLFAVLGDHVWIACLLLLPFAALAPIETLYITSYRHPSSADILATVFASNFRETREYLGGVALPLFISVGVALGVTLLAAHWSKRARLRWRHGSRAWILSIAIATPVATVAVASALTPGNMDQRLRSGLQTVTPLTDSIESGYPFGVFERAIAYHREWTQLRSAAARLDAFRFHARRIDDSVPRQIYVLVIGESSRRDHWQLFGYARPTTPELMQVHDLIPISDMVSSWSASMMAIPMIVTRKPPTDEGMIWHEASILRAMQEAGFETYWISNQMPIGQFDSPVSTYALEARHVTFLNHASWISPGSYDENLVVALRDALEKPSHDLFIVLHMMGSHGGYDNRYPSPYAQFRPTLAEANAPTSVYERRRNSYDNTILYTDHVLATIIHILEKRSEISAVWFESDHGEDLPTPTCSLSGHGNGTPYDFEVPAFFWYSDSYASHFPGRVAALRKNADKRTTSAVTFESLVDMAGLDFPGHDRSMSLFSPQWHPGQRIVHGAWQVDIDHADFSKRCTLALPPDA